MTTDQELTEDIYNYVMSLPKEMPFLDKIKASMQEFTDTYDVNPSDEEMFKAIILDAVYSNSKHE